MKKQKILIIEDETIIALNIKSILESKGYVVCDIGISADEAVNLTEKYKPDLIIIDIILNGENDGIIAVEDIKERYDISIVYLTAHSDENTIQRVKKTEPNGYIIKPVNQEELLSTVEIALYKHEMEKKLRESEEKYKKIIEQTTDVIWEMDMEWNFLFASPSIYRLFGYSIEEVISLNMKDLLSPESFIYAQNVTAAEFRKVKEITDRDNQGKKINKRRRIEPVIFELEFIRKNGSMFYGEVSSRFNYNKDREPVNISGVIRDITDRKQIEEALKESEAKFKNLTEKSPTGIYIIQDGLFKYANPRLAEIFGYTVEEVIDKIGPRELTYHEDWHIAEENIMQREKSYVKSINYTFRGVTRSKDMVYIEAYGSQTLFEGKLAVIGTLLDITDRKLAEEQVKSFLREKETLLQEIHHRVKNNLQVISSLIDLQVLNLEGKTELAPIEVISRRIKSMALVHEKLYQSKNVAEIDFDEYIRALSSEISESISQIHCKITTVIDVDSINLNLDKAIPCGLIINELILNSYKHAFPKKKKGEIKIEFKNDKKGNYSLTISDNGINLPGDFDINKTEALGMQLVNAWISQLKGKLKLGKGKGAVFNITFPGK